LQQYVDGLKHLVSGDLDPNVCYIYSWRPSNGPSLLVTGKWHLGFRQDEYAECFKYSGQYGFYSFRSLSYLADLAAAPTSPGQLPTKATSSARSRSQNTMRTSHLRSLSSTSLRS
jgi:hypothetical protein